MYKFIVVNSIDLTRYSLCWWIATLGASAKAAYPEGVHFCDEIGVSQEDFEYALGRKWLMSTEFPYSNLRPRRVRNFTFVTVGVINPFSDYRSEVATPTADSRLIVSSSSSSSSWAIPVRQLLRSIDEESVHVSRPTPSAKCSKNPKIRHLKW
jgi:hypothetical protein